MEQTAVKGPRNRHIPSIILFQIYELQHLIIFLDPLLLLELGNIVVSLLNKGRMGLCIVAALRMLHYLCLYPIAQF